MKISTMEKAIINRNIFSLSSLFLLSSLLPQLLPHWPMTKGAMPLRAQGPPLATIQWQPRFPSEGPREPEPYQLPWASKPDPLLPVFLFPLKWCLSVSNTRTLDRARHGIQRGCWVAWRRGQLWFWPEGIFSSEIQAYYHFSLGGFA